MSPTAPCLQVDLPRMQLQMDVLAGVTLLFHSMHFYCCGVTCQMQGGAHTPGESTGRS